jgi:hypothetical protein
MTNCLGLDKYVCHNQDSLKPGWLMYLTQKVKKIVSSKWESVLTEFHCNIFRNQFGGVV